MNRTAILVPVAAFAMLMAACDQAPQPVSPAAREGHVEVAASDGVVTLYGTVAGAREKEQVALLAMSVDGVRSVVNNLVVVAGS